MTQAVAPLLNGVRAAGPRQPLPVISSASPRRQKLGIVACYIVLVLCIFSLPLLGALGVASYFRLSPETRALRSSVMESVPGKWNKQIAVNVGGFTLGLVRFGSSFFHLPPEARAALQAVDGADVGVYQLRNSPPALSYSGMLAAADQSMRRRGWERIVGVVQDRQFVAVYMPRSLRPIKGIKCCVMVLDGHVLVVASVRGNPESLLALAAQRYQSAAPL
ncbi:MAG: hypothetical protein ACLQVY_02880 [Limisphaerales bacterium]